MWYANILVSESFLHYLVHGFPAPPPVFVFLSLFIYPVRIQSAIIDENGKLNILPF